MRKLAAAATIACALFLAGTSQGESLSHPAERKTLPANVEAERSVLGAILLDNNALLAVSPILKETNFCSQQHQIIYRAMQHIAALGRKIDLVTLVDFLRVNEKIDKAGGDAYISCLTDGVPYVSNVESYAHIIREKALRRAMIHLCDKLQREAWEGTEAIAETIEGGVDRFLSLNADDNAPLMRDFGDVAASAVQQLEQQVKNTDEAFALRSGLQELDDITHGFRRGEIVLIVGPTSHGKTLLAEQIATIADADGFKGIFFSAEMSGEEIALRELAWAAKVNQAYIRRPDKLREERHAEKLEKLKAAAQDAKSSRLKVVDKEITPARIWALSQLHQRTKGLDFVVVDYDQLVVDAGMGNADLESSLQFQHRFMLDVKQLTGRLNVCFFLLAQLRKLPPGIWQGGKPMLDDIYGPSSMRNTPQIVLFVLREFFIKKMDPKFERQAKVFVLKARGSRTGTAELDFDPELVRFQNRVVADWGEEVADPPEET